MTGVLRLDLAKNLSLSHAADFHHGLLVVLLVSAALASPSAAQSPCDVLLPQAEKSYEEARFAAVPELLEGCLKSRPSRRERAEAYVLMAKAYVMDDRLHRARQATEQILRFDSEFEGDPRRDPPRFVAMVAEVRRELTTTQVSSVSKFDESLAEAPATVAVITAEEIARRGYLDLEQVLHDLPGFDISRNAGLAYANVYQRGLRSNDNTRTLLLIDGVEENDLWSQVAYISRQTPLSNVERIEVIYGPASTMYGANAFAGVVNIITSDPENLIEEGRRFGANVVATAGSLGTDYVDATVAGRSESGLVSWSLTSRVFRSDELDLSRFDDWDYDPADFERVSYAGLLNIQGVDQNGNYRAQQFLDQTGLGTSPYYTVSSDGSGVATAIELTPAGAQRAVELDQQVYSQEVLGRPVNFSNPTRDHYVYAKLKLSNLVLGFGTWNYDEGGTPWYTDFSRAAGSDAGPRWDFKADWLYAKYSRPIGRNLSLNVFGRYKSQELGNNLVITVLNSYAGGQLGLQQLAADVPASWGTIYLYQQSSQLRAEANAAYNPSEKFNLVGGVELRNGSLQGNLLLSFEPNPSETGFTFGPGLAGDNHFKGTDLGAYAQASYRPSERVKIVVGGRVDNNEVRETLGYGTVFVPRLALIYMPRNFVFKAIYAEAFQPAANAQKYAVTPGNVDFPSLDLEPERIENIELAASWQPPGSNFVAEVSAYQAEVSDVVQLVTVPCDTCPSSTTFGYRGIGAFRIRGLQGTASWRYKDYTISGNYTYTDPFNTAPVDISDPALSPLRDEQGNLIEELPVGDIADHQLKVQFGARLWRELSLSVQASYVGSRRTGKGTTTDRNPFDSIDSFFVANAALLYEPPRGGFSFQLIANNVFDRSYYHPGIAEADGTVFAARSPQAGRTFFGRVVYSF